MQSGFRAGHGCTSATLKVLNDILTAIDKKHYCAAVFIDLAKAFDSVNHHILIGRLDSLGFSNDCLAWFTNYFSDRVQCVKSEGLLSGPLAVSMGVSQGSILGPTLFSVYINEVALAAGESLIHLYADDTILYTSGPSLDTVLTTLQASFNAIQLSFRGLQLLLNTSKTKCMLFNRSLPAPARLSNITTLDGFDLEYVDNYKYLGVWLDCKLSFQTHIKHLQSKVKSRIGFLFRNKASFTHAAKHTLVKLTFLPILDFGDVLYKIASNTLLNKLDAVYHSAICFVTKAPYTTHHCDLYALVGWPSLHTRRQTHWLHVIYKTLLGKVPPYLSSLVTIASPTCSLYLLFIYFAPLHPIIFIYTLHILPLQIYHSSVLLAILYLLCHHGLFCLYLPYLTSFAHIVYRLVYTVLLTVCLFYSMCNSVSLYVSNCFALSWPGRNCK
uniref:Reverse transcriptase domain-containing protein n=1 Tax=Oncorhynchus mykiss TaxID=8022 RepID=A0A8K9XH44_ONCMY